MIILVIILKSPDENQINHPPKTNMNANSTFQEAF